METLKFVYEYGLDTGVYNRRAQYQINREIFDPSDSRPNTRVIDRHEHW